MMARKMLAPRSVTLLNDYLTQTPLPTDVNIAILDPDPKAEYPERAYAKVDTHLGINAPDLPQLAREFREEYALLRRRYRQRGADSNNNGMNGVDNTELASRIFSTTTCLLLVCPDHSTAWADRRRVLLRDSNAKEEEEDILQKELGFCNLLFTQHSKAPSSWAHRKWIGKKLINLISENIHASNINKHDATTKLQAWAIAEIDTCSMVAEKYPKNYHAWTHRRWVLQMIFAQYQEAIQKNRINLPLVGIVFQILKNELSTTENWMKTHVTDHSAVHYRGQVLQLSLVVRMHPASMEMLKNELQLETKEATAWNLISDSMAVARSSRFKSYEVTWIHRRICGLACLNYFLKNHIFPSHINPKLDEFITMEIRDLAAEYLANDNNCPKSKMLALSYVLWIIQQMKRSELWKICPTEEVTSLAKEVVNTLACCEATVGNVWRIMNNRGTI